MMRPSILKAITVILLMSVNCFIHGQIKQSASAENSGASILVKPYKILTNGKQITIQSKQNLKSIMVWTASGHRIVEEKQMQTNSYSFNVPTKEKVFFIMIETAEGKRFTERMGVK